MRVWVLKRRKLKNSLRFSFLLLVTHWFADILRDQRKNLRDFLFYAYNIVSLYKKKALSFTPLNCALKNQRKNAI